MDTSAVWAAFIAGTVAVLGYLVGQFQVRRDHKARVYAQALAALRRYAEYPYLVLRRTASSPEVRSALGRERSEIISDVSYHRALLRMESPVVGAAYTRLWMQLRLLTSMNGDIAWRQPVMTMDEQMTENPPFTSQEIQEELEVCLRAMRRDLSIWAPLLRRRTMKQVQTLGSPSTVAPPISPPRVNP